MDYLVGLNSVIGTNPYLLVISQDSAVGIATDYRLDDQEVGGQVPVGTRIFFSPRRPDRPWVPPSLLSNG
jgi:hypothetical protein